MAKLSWLIFKKETKFCTLEIRKINNGSAGISVEVDNDYDSFVFAEAFINKKDAIELIKALREYFNIKGG